VSLLGKSSSLQWGLRLQAPIVKGGEWHTFLFDCENEAERDVLLTAIQIAITELDRTAKYVFRVFSCVW
jgi:hypothetical protein